MEPWMWLIVVLVVVAVVAVVVVLAQRRARRDHLRARFGPEYDRAVGASKDRGAAERHLEQMEQRRDSLDLTELSAVARARYDEQWEAVQARFVDEPGQAVSDADGLVAAVMRDRGYPLDTFDERAQLLATDHPEVIKEYRAAHAAHTRHLTNPAKSSDTEDLRQAFRHYRALYQALTGTAPDGEPQTTLTPEPVPREP